MRILNTLICVAVCLSLGCAKSGDNASPTSFRVTSHRLIDTKDVLVHHVTIEAPGERFVRVNAEGEVFCQTTLKPEGNDSTLKFELIFVAVLIKKADSPNVMKWYMQVKLSGSTLGHPEMIESEAQTFS